MLDRAIDMPNYGGKHTTLLPVFLTADTAINLNDPTAASLIDNLLAQRGVLRGDFAAIALGLVGFSLRYFRRS